MRPHALIIDDNPQNVVVLENLLTKQGVSHTHIANTSYLATILSQMSDVHLVFLDLEMPGRNGYDVLEMLRSTPQLSTVPVVAYTVHTSEMNVAYQHGFNGFISKPLDAERFPDQLHRILEGTPVWESY